MSKKIYTLLLIFNVTFLIFNSQAATNISVRNISGNWPLTGSPYNLNGSVIIPNDSTLILERGLCHFFNCFSKLNN